MLESDPILLCYTHCMELALKIRPQRSTQYAQMTNILALPELLISPLAEAIVEAKPATLAGQGYLLVKFAGTQISDVAPVLEQLGAISEMYEYFEQIGSIQGPLLRPIEPSFLPSVPVEMAEIRRYKGKTNEIFTRVLLNAAIFAGAFKKHESEKLRILDPLAGGGTTLFLALAAGHDAFGIELERQDVETTAVFISQYLKGEHIPFKETDERGRKAGRRYQFEIGKKGKTQLLVLAHGDTRAAHLHLRDIPGGAHMHAVVGDLPYGIQHFGEIAALLNEALPVWEQCLLPGGTLALAWNATRIERAAMVKLVQELTQLQVHDAPPYTEFAHPVDRVIKRRDILVALKPLAGSNR